MQVVPTLQVLPAITDQANLYLGLSSSTTGRTNSFLASPSLWFNPSANLLSLSGSLSTTNTVYARGGLSTDGSLDLNNATLVTDSTTGAMAIIPAPTSTVANPIGLVINPTGFLGLINSSGGLVTAASVAAASATAAAAGGLASLVKVYNFLGSVTVGEGGVRWYPQTNIVVLSAYITAGTPPTIGSMSLSIKKNGSEIATANLPSNTNNSATQTLNISATTTDYFTVDVTSSGGASNASLTLVYYKTS